MIYVVDRIENDIAVLENTTTKETKDVELNKLPCNLKEGNVLKYENNTYTLDETLEQERKNAILEKFNRLKNKDNQ